MDFNKIYLKSHFFEAAVFKSASDVLNIIQNGDYSKAEYFNGKKNLPSWLLSMTPDEQKIVEDGINKVISSITNNINFIVTLLLKKSSNVHTFKNIISNSIDTLIALSETDLKAKWLKELESYKKVISSEYEDGTWHKLEKDILEIKEIKSIKNKKEVKSNNSLYTLLSDKGEWKLYIPKSFEGDSELASHMIPFIYEGKTYNKARWCTAADERYYKGYTEENNKLYVIKHFIGDKCDEMYQVAFYSENSVEFMDKADLSFEDKGNSIRFLLDNCNEEILKNVINDNPSAKEKLTLLDYKTFCKEYNTYNVAPSTFFWDRQDVCEKILDIQEKGQEIFSYNNNVFGVNIINNEIEIDCNHSSYEYQEGVFNTFGSKCHITLNNVKELYDIPYLDKAVDLTLIFSESYGLDSFHSTPKLLRKIELKNCISLGMSVFMNCSNLETVILSSNLEVIGSFCFEGCTSLKSVTNGNNITRIGKCAFYNTPNLKEFTVPESCEYIGNSAFSNCGLDEVYIPLNCEVSHSAFGELEEDFTPIKGNKYIPVVKVHKGFDTSIFSMEDPYDTVYSPKIEYIEKKTNKKEKLLKVINDPYLIKFKDK